MSVRERLYKGLYELRHLGHEAGTIYLSNKYMNELHEEVYTQNGRYGDKPAQFAGVPIIEVVGHPDHLCIIPKKYSEPTDREGEK